MHEHEEHPAADCDEDSTSATLSKEWRRELGCSDVDTDVASVPPESLPPPLDVVVADCFVFVLRDFFVEEALEDPALLLLLLPPPLSRCDLVVVKSMIVGAPKIIVVCQLFCYCSCYWFCLLVVSRQQHHHNQGVCCVVLCSSWCGKEKNDIKKSRGQTREELLFARNSRSREDRHPTPPHTPLSTIITYLQHYYFVPVAVGSDHQNIKKNTGSPP